MDYRPNSLFRDKTITRYVTMLISVDEAFKLQSDYHKFRRDSILR